MPALLALRQRRALASPRPPPASPAHDGRTLNHTMLRVLLLAPLALLLAACDATIPTDGPTGPDPIEPISANESALVTAAFEEVEELFSLGFGDSGSAARAASASGASAMASMSARVDTTTYTGVYDATNAKGFLVQLQYREPQGVGVWQARVQHARDVGGLDAVDHLVGFVNILLKIPARQHPKYGNTAN